MVLSESMGDSKFNVTLAGSIKSSTILNVNVLAMVKGRGSNNFINNESSSSDLSRFNKKYFFKSINHFSSLKSIF